MESLRLLLSQYYPLRVYYVSSRFLGSKNIIIYFISVFITAAQTNPIPNPTPIDPPKICKNYLIPSTKPISTEW
jgi:hypothetical protein